MDIKEFFKICQRVSVLPETTMYIKTSIPPELTVLCEEIQFYPIGCEKTYKQGIPQYTAILHDIKAHSVIYADLDKVEKYKE